MIKHIKELRTQHKFKPSQEAIAKEIGCSLSQFKRYENGKSTIPLLVAVKWAEVLGISINEFIKLYIK